MADGAKQTESEDDHSIKETVISLLIALVMALVFRSYVVEAFVIPTGSMAPTLMGKHTLHNGRLTGYDWAQNPTYYADPRRQIPLPTQGGAYGRPLIAATDPMTTNLFNPPSELTNRRHGVSTRPASKPLRAGDRILVQKYLYELFPPTRYDVVVFKNPTDPQQNFIKRLVGLPNEQVLLAEGDVFARPLDDDGRAVGNGEYTIRRKPRRVMRDLWRPLFSSEYTPLRETSGFAYPWRGEGWTVAGTTLRHETGDDAELLWNAERWPIWDWVPYNEPDERVQRLPYYPVGDVRLRAGIQPGTDGADVSAIISTRGHEFRASIIGDGATIAMRANDGTSRPSEWRALASAEIDPLDAGAVTNVEFWHYDQRLELHVDGEIAATADYDWNASDRLLHTTGAARAQYEQRPADAPELMNPKSYTRASTSVAWRFGGGPVTLHRVGLDRDVYHRPYQHAGGYGHASHPRTAIKLGPDHFFVLGDNSPASQDGRAWREVDPRVAETVDETVGVVHRDLMQGKAFFVYFPSVHSLLDRVPIPNAGKLRLIR